jgi:hypothetical protein
LELEIKKIYLIDKYEVKVRGDKNVLDFLRTQLTCVQHGKHDHLFLDDFLQTADIRISSSSYSAAHLRKMGVIHTLAGEGFKIMKNSMQVVDQENGTERLMMYKEIQQ